MSPRPGNGAGVLSGAHRDIFRTGHRGRCAHAYGGFAARGVRCGVRANCTGPSCASACVAPGYPAAMSDRPYRVYRGGRLRGGSQDQPELDPAEPLPVPPPPPSTHRRRASAMAGGPAADRGTPSAPPGEAPEQAAAPSPVGPDPRDRPGRGPLCGDGRVAGAGLPGVPGLGGEGERGQLERIHRAAPGGAGARPAVRMLLSQPTTILVMGRETGTVVSDSLQLIRVDPGGRLGLDARHHSNLKVDIPGVGSDKIERRVRPRRSGAGGRDRPQPDRRADQPRRARQLLRVPPAGRRRRWHRHLQQGAPVVRLRRAHVPLQTRRRT